MQSLATALLLLLATAGAVPSGWRVVASLPGVFDVAGPRADGRLVVAGSQGLWLLDPRSGATERFAPAYGSTGTYEAYIAVVPTRPVSSCFTPDDIFALSPQPANAVTRIGAQGGTPAHFAAVPGVDSLAGIALDGVGSFGGRLLVFGAHAGKTTVAAIDCRGVVSVITTSAPVAEGGDVVAPLTFGQFGGDLILTDELSGRVFAVTPQGKSLDIANPPLAHGQDTGVEGAGFVPPGKVAQDQVLFADRATPGNPHPGSDYLLSASGTQLDAARVRQGDLLVATEGGAALDAIRCAAACSVTAIIPANASSHGEGHVLVLVLAAPATSKAPRPGFGQAPPKPAPILQIVLLALVVAALVLLAIRVWAGRGSRSEPR